MSAKHLKKGDALPPFNGTLRIYNMRFCPYGHRAILALNAKGVPYETVHVHLREKPEWFFVKSPLGGKVPSIEVADGDTVCESLIGADFVDELFPQNPLNSKDPLRKAHDRLVVERFSSVITSIFKVLYSSDKIDETILKTFMDGLETVQTELKQRGTKFLFSQSQPGMVDYMIWPWFERLGLVLKKLALDVELDGNKFALLNSWISNMKENPAVKSFLLTTEQHEEFITAKYDADIYLKWQ